jgi:hypothetical protein
MQCAAPRFYLGILYQRYVRDFQDTGASVHTSAVSFSIGGVEDGDVETVDCNTPIVVTQDLHYTAPPVVGCVKDSIAKNRLGHA